MEVLTQSTDVRQAIGLPDERQALCKSTDEKGQTLLKTLTFIALSSARRT